MKTLLLIDGSNLIFRAFFASEESDLRTLDGRPCNAISRLITMFNKMIREENPTHVYIANDPKGKTFRHEMYQDYKAGRNETPSRLKEQFPMALDLYNAMGIKNECIEGYEADDLIATLAKKAEQNGYKVKIISGDKDLLQLVSENITVITPANGRFVKRVEYDLSEFEERFHIAVDKFIAYKSLIGDKSDNIIGINKVGPKKAETLLTDYDSIEEIVKAAEDGEITGKLGESLIGTLEQLNRNIELVTLVDDVNVSFDLDDLELNNFVTNDLIDYLHELGLNKDADILLKEHEISIEEKDRHHIEIINNFDQKIHSDDITFIYTQTLDTNYLSSQLLGFGISSNKGNFFLEHDNVDKAFIEFLESDKIKVTYDLKRMCSMYQNIDFNNFQDDLYVALNLIDVTTNNNSMNNVLSKYNIRYLLRFDQVYKVIANPKMPDLDLLSKDITLKAIALKEVYSDILKELEELNLNELYKEIELPLIKVLSKMEVYGIYIDNNELESIKEQYNKVIIDIDTKIKQITDINISSPLQIQKLLFEQFQLPTKGLKKTAKGISTDVDNLNKLLEQLEQGSKEHTLITLILEYRKYTKLISTYLQGIQNYIKDERINPIYNQLLSETGRLSTKDPSIQNIPIRTNEGQVIRKLFAAKDKNIVAIDYSQVELRVMAHISEDPKLIKAFKDNEDIHARTAIEMFGSSEGNNRSKAKAINFGIIYGMSRFGLANQVGISTKEAEEYIDKYFLNYPYIKKYIDNTIDKATEEGLVYTLYNRRRNISFIKDGNFRQVEHAKNAAINTPIQGSAADLIKLAMIKVQDYIKDTDIKMIMQIHDELVFEMSDQEIDIHLKEICNIMENVITLKVPLKVDYGIGKNWFEAK
ncbi:MAG: DNA polymerase I [Mycoplasmatales bacterium]